MSVLCLLALELGFAGPIDGLEARLRPSLSFEEEGLEQRAMVPSLGGFEAATFAWREAKRSTQGEMDGFRMTWDARAPEGSGSPTLSSVLESLGRRVSDRLFLGVTVDRLGFEEYEGGRVAILDPRHGTPRMNTLATGVGLTLGF
jgi:hypothetical protein